MKVHLSLQILAVALLFNFARASPFDLHDETEGPLLFGRATGTKYVGSNCTSSAECYSANCVKADETSAVGTCQRQPAEGPCFKDANCASYNCNGATCVGTTKLYGECKLGTPCVGSNLQCYAGICLRTGGAKCSSNKQCASNKCANGACTKTLTPSNKECVYNTDCESGVCQTPDNGYGCRDNDGNPTKCPVAQVYLGSEIYADICARRPLGEPCTYQGDCQIGVCRNGVCSANGEGQSCINDYACSDVTARCESGKCRTPANGTLPARAICGNDAQCSSGHCKRGFVLQKDTQGVNGGSWGGSINRRYTQGEFNNMCDYLQEGDTGCKSLLDCDKQLCKNSTCVYGSTGDRCTINYQCSSGVCGKDGKCLSGVAGTNWSVGHPCSNPNQCVTNNCQPEKFTGRSVPRPSLADPNVTAYESDSVCLPVGLGGSCRYNYDCTYSNTRKCINGKCTKSS
ncbi:hypothetical protein V8E36_002265 [Tilletia maclaganii]